MMNDFDALAKKLLRVAALAGADAADVILVDAKDVSIDVRDGMLEHAERSESVDIGLRVLIGQKQACVSVSDTSDHTLEQMAERAVAMAKVAPEDQHIGLADADQLAQAWDVDALELADASDKPTPEMLQQTAQAAEAAALAVSGVAQVLGASSGWAETQIHLAASNGFSGGYRRTSFSTSCGAIAGDGLQMERDYCGEGRAHFADLPDAEAIGKLAGERAVAKFGAVKPPTGTYPILFDERISSTLIGHLLSAINGNSIVRGSSWLKDALGAQILPMGIDLVEDPTRARVSGSKPFDAEGLPVAVRHIIENGVLQGWTLDLASARKLGMKSTGNASRGVGSPPSPSSGNMALLGGVKSRDQLVSDMGTGLLVTGMIGSTISPTTGDYSRGANGFWVENGQIMHPVNECTIAGNLHQMLAGMIPANDGRAHLSRVIPSLLIESMVIAGA
ncbi:MAG: TldD/PmbA family protein [Amylibacter sp.]|nr:TldD/PmbA family protein [Amylibacter sp.]